jgi:epoxyqueuosine reductase
VIERDLAVQAGLGWIGKNTCLLNEALGSYVFLGVLISNLDLSQDAPVLDKCLDCRLCVDACPTGALKPYELEPQKCLAYQNIERRGPRDESIFTSLEDHLVGCDVCQEVCPFNFEIAESQQTVWLSGFKNFDLGDFKKILQMTTGDYKRKTKDSAMSRIRYPDFMRNVFLVIAASARQDLWDAVLGWQAAHPDLDLAEYDYCLKKIRN